MKKKLAKLLACILVVGMLLPATGTAALADGVDGTTTSGTGTPEDPKLTTSTVTDTDAKTGETTVTITIEKEWTDEGVDGEEHGTQTEVTDKTGGLVSASGEANGSETTGENSSEEKESTVEIDNGTGSVPGGPGIEAEVPDVTVGLTPGSKDENSETSRAWFDEDTLELPDWVRPADENGHAWITEGSSTESDGTVTNITVENDAVANSTTYTKTTTTPDGKLVRETVTCTRDENGNITGYSVLTTETVPATTEDSAPPANATINADGGWTSYDYELPEKPEVASPPDCDSEGNVINGEVVAEIRDENGSLVGYTVVTVKNGVAVSYSDPILGRYVATTTVEEKLENGLVRRTTTKTTVTKMKSASRSGEVSDGVRTVLGWMGDVSGSVERGDMETFEPGIKNSGNKKTDSLRDLFNRPYELSEYDENADEFFQWLGEYGIESAIRVKQGSVDSWQPHQFVLAGADGSKYYVYCCDFDVSPKGGARYNMERIEDADYYKNNDGGAAEDQIRAIVRNGYWGVENTSADPTSPTPGSLDAFRKMLVDAGLLTSEQASAITDGMALTATQAAIWYYGNSGSDLLDDDDIAGRYCTDGKLGATDADKKALVNEIYRYLIKGMPGQKADAGNTLITAEDFAKNIDLTVGRRNDDDRYETDISITMAVIPDSSTSDLIVYVTADGENIGAYRLCGDGSADAANNIANAVRNADGSYTLKGVPLPGGKNITLNLKGTQNIENGVYLFTCAKDGEPSQTFVGAGAAQQDIDLSVDFGFSVTDPTVTVSSTGEDSGAEKLEWSSEYYTFSNDDGGSRNMDVPKTGDGLYGIQIALAIGMAFSLAAALMFLRRARAGEAA